MSLAKKKAAAPVPQLDLDPDTVEGGIGGASVIHSREKVNLCYEIILDHFGSITARVAAILLQRGRLTFRDICRFLANPALHAPTGYIADAEDDSKESTADGTEAYLGIASGGAGTSSSGFSGNRPLKSHRIIQQALLTLIQHNMCWHARTNSNGTLVETVQDDNSIAPSVGTEHFQMNVDAVLPRLRFGAYLTFAGKHFGQTGRAIIDEILQNGKMRASDVIERLSSPANGSSVSENSVRSILTDLLTKAYIQPHTSLLNTSPRDRRIHKEATMVMSDKKHKTEKDRKGIAQLARHEVAKEDKAAWYYSHDSSTRLGLMPAARPKRKSNGKAVHGSQKPSAKKARSSKRVKKEDEVQREVNGRNSKHLVLSDDEDDESDDRYTQDNQNLTIDPDCVLRINFSRFDIHLRDEIITQTVASRYNDTVARAMEAMLHVALEAYQVDTWIPGVHSSVSPAFHLHALRDELRHQDPLKSAFGHSAMKQMGKDGTQHNFIVEIINVLMKADDISESGQAKRFVMAAPEAVASNSSGTSSPSRTNAFVIHYRNIARALRAQLLQNVVRSQFDSQGVRVVSLLMDMGKLDEKQISKLCLMAIGETRDVCARLFASGLLSLQEVPKSNDRTPARTFFLWYIDVSKCNAWLANRLYKSLTRIAQRRRQEFIREAHLAAKVYRAHIAAEQEGMMHGIEQMRLDRVHETIRILTLAEMRTWRDLFVVTTLPE